MIPTPPPKKKQPFAFLQKSTFFLLHCYTPPFLHLPWPTIHHLSDLQPPQGASRFRGMVRWGTALQRNKPSTWKKAETRGRRKGGAKKGRLEDRNPQWRLGFQKLWAVRRNSGKRKQKKNRNR